MVLKLQNFTSLLLKCMSNVLVKRSFLLGSAFATVIVELLSPVHLASFVIKLPK